LYFDSSITSLPSTKRANYRLLLNFLTRLIPIQKLFYRKKNLPTSFTNELLSLDDKEKLSDIAVNQYINSYKTVKADYLDYCKGKGI